MAQNPQIYSSSPDYELETLPEILDGQSSPEVAQDLQKDPGPVTTVTQFAKVRQWFLWWPYCTLKLWQFITYKI